MKELTLNDLVIDPKIPKEVSEDYSSNDWGVIGQPRAVEALEMGLTIQAKGYNLFVTGESGTGRNTAVMEILKNFRHKKRPLQDLVYVFNFEDEKSPQVLIFQEGEAERFKTQMGQFIDKIKSLVKEKLDSQAYKDQRDSEIKTTELKENHSLNEFDKTLKNQDFCLVQMEDDDEEATTDIAPVRDEKPISFEDLHELIDSGEITEEQWTKKREEYFHLMDQMKAIYRELKENRKILDQNLDKLRSQLVKPALIREINLLKQEWDQADYMTYISSLERDISQNLDLFSEEDEDDEDSDLLLRYQVNIL
ncbi:MAG: AAA family ATPase, partial [Spirochaetaceae bacterium]|nr:AAA family ATPase [Spirochaetaceae bacterium]